MGETPTELLYEDGIFAVFRDIKPATQHHYLVIPKEHITNAKQLNGEQHLNLITQMHTIGLNVLEKQGGDKATVLCGYHWPPFTLISHLHLHVIGKPESMGFLAKRIFSKDSFWFVSQEWMVNHLKP